MVRIRVAPCDFRNWTKGRPVPGELDKGEANFSCFDYGIGFGGTARYSWTQPLAQRMTWLW